MIQTILIVDDSRDIQEMLGMVLKMEGYTVAQASNGQEALAWLESNHPNLILLDVMMPVMDGPTFLTTLRASRSHLAHVPVVVLTADQYAQHHMSHLDVASFLSKPCHLDTLLETIGQHLAPVATVPAPSGKAPSTHV